ncbi:MAG: hypothetical protein MUP81_02850 [Dehalococcoidia bacterium]|nr:hypothetical protein [Dehalococcoidia bacterium]
MADKMERWFISMGGGQGDGGEFLEIFAGEEGERDKGLMIADDGRVYKATKFICDVYDKPSAKSIVALHNAACDVNESNPMAVAQGLQRLIDIVTVFNDDVYLTAPHTAYQDMKGQDVCAGCGAYFLTGNRNANKLQDLVVKALAAITKPAIGDKEN